MDAVTRRDLLNCSLSLERFDRDLRFQLGTELSVLSHVCLLRQPKSTLGPCPNFWGVPHSALLFGFPRYFPKFRGTFIVHPQFPDFPQTKGHLPAIFRPCSDFLTAP